MYTKDTQMNLILTGLLYSTEEDTYENSRGI